MSSEIEVPETPNWLSELEAKRERRLKPRLGHESGAGAPCLKCGDKCPGLDLHFWRKCCKICKCAKEEHEVQDDDIYGWAQFQLLGNKPNKIKRKIVLPGKKDEVELDWVPKGHNDTVDKYLKTLPPEQLPVKGSQAAQDRKQLLHKQIPIHDIDPTLCHELSIEELKQMNDYISHVKQTSVGVGQIVSLSSIIKGNLHTLNPAEAAIIASRYAKGVPLSEIVKLQSQSKASLLKPNLTQNLAKMNLKDSPGKGIPNLVPNTLSQTERSVSPLVANKIHDVSYPGYAIDTNQILPNAQFSTGLKPGQYRGYDNQGQPIDPSIDGKYLQNPNFDPKNVPSQFIHQTMPYGNLPYDENSIGRVSADGAGHFQTQNAPHDKSQIGYKSGGQSMPHDKNPIGYKSGDGAGHFQTQNTPYDKNSHDYNSGDGHFEDQSMPYEKDSLRYNSGKGNSQGNSAFVPYSKVSSGIRPGENYIEGGKSPVGNYAQRLPGRNFAKNNLQPENSNASAHSLTGEESASLSAEELRKKNHQGFPNYAAGKYNVYADIQSPTKIPKNVRDLAFSTYDPSDMDPNDNSNLPTVPNENYSSGNNTGNNYGGNRPIGLQNPNQSGLGKDNNLMGRNLGKTDNNYPGTTLDKISPTGQFPPRSPSNVAQQHHGERDNNYPRRILDKSSPTGQFPPRSPSNVEHHGTVGNAYHGDPYIQQNVYDPNVEQNQPYNQQSNVVERGTAGSAYHKDPYNVYDPNVKQNLPYNNQLSNIAQYGPVGSTYQDDPYNQKAMHDPKAGHNSLYDQQAAAYDPNIQQNTPYNEQASGAYDPNVPYGQQNTPYENHPSGLSPGRQGGRFNPTKKLSELIPGNTNINEDFLEPSQVNVGPIQDINYPEIKAATHGTNDFYEDYSPDSLREILNNIKLPDCHYCKKPFEENEFAITIDRANVLFHAECFKCAGCNQILADNVYFYNKETDNIYCGRDYAKIRGFPRCKACDELIFTKEYCLAENSTFHLKHFCCIECDRPLAGQDYTLEDEMPYCLPCFEQSKASKCSTCCRVIKPDEIGCNLNGVHFHAVDECFACKMCKRPLMGQKLLLRNQKLYCSHDCFGADK